MCVFLCTDHWGRLSYLSSLFGILHSNGCIFPFFICLYLLFFDQLFVSPPKTNILPFCISFSWGWSWSLPPVQWHVPPSTVLQTLWSMHLFNSKRICCTAGASGDSGSSTGSGRSPGGGHSDPLYYSCLENPMDRGASQARVHRVSESIMTEVTYHACTGLS